MLVSVDHTPRAWVSRQSMVLAMGSDELDAKRGSCLCTFMVLANWRIGELSWLVQVARCAELHLKVMFFAAHVVLLRFACAMHCVCT